MRQISKCILIFLAVLLTACQAAPPLPALAAAAEVEFALVPGQTAMITNTGLSLRLTGIAGDERCPSQIECAESGPVTLSISVQKDSSPPVEFTLQSFTDNNGRTPEGPFEGIQDRIEYEDYLIQVKGILPYPAKSSNAIGDADYRVAFLVTAKQ